MDKPKNDNTITPILALPVQVAAAGTATNGLLMLTLVGFEVDDEDLCFSFDREMAERLQQILRDHFQTLEAFRGRTN